MKNWLDPWIAPATREFFREAARIPGFSLFDRLHGYFYARWTFFYIRTGINGLPGARLFGKLLPYFTHNSASDSNTLLANTYHGKVLPLQAAREIVSVQENISLPDLENVIPYPIAHDLILKNPDHILALDCPCRSARPNPCSPMDVCLIIGEPFAGMIANYQPKRARYITPTEAIEIVEAEEKRGHVHHAFFKDAMLGRFYALCNCCPCCCGALQAHQGGMPMLASSGYVCRVTAENCLGCGACEAVCAFHALETGSGTAQVNEALCLGCGLCVSRCSQDALTLVCAPERGTPLDIRALKENQKS